MRKLEELIQKYCPDGVEYVKLGDFAIVYDGTHQTPSYKDSGIPFISVENIGDIYSSRKHISKEDFDKYKIKPQVGDVFMTRIGRIGACAVFDKQAEIAYYVSLALIRPNLNVVHPRYLKHIIESQVGYKELRKRTLVNAVPIKVNKEDIGKICIPLPPLPVQEEIVKILDAFTEQQIELQIDLQTELQKRQQQYSFYRDLLLTNVKDYKEYCISDIACYRRGSFPQPYTNTEFYGGKDSMPFVQVADIANEGFLLNETTNQTISKIAQPKSVFVPKGTVICSLQGSIGRVAITQYDAYVDRTIAIFNSIDSRLDKRYFAFQLSRVFSIAKEKARGGTIKTITKEEFSEFKIKVPSLSEQQKIVDTLGQLDTLTTSLSKGLSSEIEKRRQQYEYYRDSLLSFRRSNP